MTNKQGDYESQVRIHVVSKGFEGLVIYDQTQ